MALIRKNFEFTADDYRKLEEIKKQLKAASIIEAVRRSIRFTSKMRKIAEGDAEIVVRKNGKESLIIIV
jgi:hypothetical protein